MGVAGYILCSGAASGEGGFAGGGDSVGAGAVVGCDGGEESVEVGVLAV